MNELRFFGLDGFGFLSGRYGDSGALLRNDGREAGWLAQRGVARGWVEKNPNRSADGTMRGFFVRLRLTQNDTGGGVGW